MIIVSEELSLRIESIFVDVYKFFLVFYKVDVRFRSL